MTEAVSKVFQKRLALYAKEGSDKAETIMSIGLLIGAGFPSCAASLCIMAAMRWPDEAWFQNMIQQAKADQS